MAKELAFVLINPYTIAKSRTGGVIARFISRTDLNLVRALMFGPSRKLVEEYAELVRRADPDHADMNNLIADYITKSYSPNPVTGKPQRVMLLLFEGEDAVAKMWHVTGSATLRWGSGETIRDTYGDYVLDENKKVQYFEPAVLVAPTKRRAEATLKLWSGYSASDGGVISGATDVPVGVKVQRTLVLIKPDNFRFASARPGNIIDLLSSSGLRIIAVKKFCMTVAQAEKFYGPVRESLRSKFREISGARAAAVLAREFNFDMPKNVVNSISSQLAPLVAEAQFEEIVQFMTGHKPSACTVSEKSVLGSEGCLGLVYEGENAIATIRDILGSTDPSKARPGSVRREFGSNIMVNAAHASDSAESARREMGIIDFETDNIKSYVDRYYGNMISRTMALRTLFPQARVDMLRKAKRLWKRKS